jgi:molybdenum cofactor cytidylyltransferase
MKSDWIAVIILAAGQSTRFGKNKLLTVFKDKKLIEHTLGPYINNQEVFKKVIVVLGSLKDDFQLLLKNSQVITTYNRDYQSSGMSSSIKVGISKLLDSKLNNCKGVIIHPADIPFVRVIPSYKNQRGHPLFFSKDLIKELSKLSDKEKGLRGYLREKKDIIKYIEVNSNRILFDVDIVEDLKKINNIFFS